METGASDEGKQLQAPPEFGSATPPKSRHYGSTSLSDARPASSKEDDLGTLVLSCIGVVTALAVGFILRQLQAMFVPLCFSLILMYIFSPFAAWTSAPLRLCCCCCGRCRDSPVGRLRCFMPRWICAVAAVMVCLSTIVVLGYLVLCSVYALQAMRDKYIHGAMIVATQVQKLLTYLKVDLRDDGVLPEVLGMLNAFVVQLPNHVSFVVERTTFVLIFLAFLLVVPIQPKQGSLYQRIDQQIRSYILIKFAVSAVVAAGLFGIYSFLGVDLALMWGVLNLVANFIPTVGPLFAVVAPLPVIVFNPDLTVAAQVLALALPLALHLVVGTVVEPHWLGTRFTLHPLTVLLSLCFWAQLWGVSGLVLAVPLMVVLRIILLQVDGPVARCVTTLLEGKIPSSAAYPFPTEELSSPRLTPP
eukprot:RCo035872